jgi:Phytochelatin synthase
VPLGARLVLALLLATVQFSGAFAEDAPPANVVQGLVPFSSDEGIARLARSTAKVDFPALANQFEPQSNPAFCGPTSAAIVLNAIRGRNPDLPRDRSRLRAEDLRYVRNFTPRQNKDGSWHVEVEWRDHVIQRIQGFKSDSEAHDWISLKSVAWARLQPRSKE